MEAKSRNVGLRALRGDGGEEARDAIFVDQVCVATRDIRFGCTEIKMVLCLLDDVLSDGKICTYPREAVGTRWIDR